MNLFPFGHATHPQWRMAAGLVIAQLRAQMTLPGHAPQPRLGLLYITDHYAPSAAEILAHLREELPMVQDWSGTVGVGVTANNAEYFDEPGIALMLCDLPAEQYRIFSGAQPLSAEFKAHTALVHADPMTPDLAELITEMAGRTECNRVVNFPAGPNGIRLVGQMVDIKIDAAMSHSLRGQLVLPN